MRVVVLLNERLPANRVAFHPVHHETHPFVFNLRKLLSSTNAHDTLGSHFFLEMNSTPDSDFFGNGDTTNKNVVHSNCEPVGLFETSRGSWVRALDSLGAAMTGGEHNHVSTTRLPGERVDAVDGETAVQNA